MNKKSTSKPIATLASKTLNNPKSSAVAKRLAGSALSQSNTNKQTGASLEGVASKILQSQKYNNTTKKLAASVLSQSNKKR